MLGNAKDAITAFSEFLIHLAIAFSTAGDLGLPKLPVSFVAFSLQSACCDFSLLGELWDHS